MITLHNSARQLPDATGVIYLRHGASGLPPEAIRDLQQFMAGLRAYYDIPDGHPVFPPMPAGEARAKAAPSVTAKNRADHPWRGAP